MSTPTPRVVTDACLPCFLHDIIGALEVLKATPEQRDGVFNQALQMLGKEFPHHYLPSFYITALHRIVKRVLKQDLPFRELRAACNKIGMDLAESTVRPAAAKLGAPYEKFRFLALWAVAGNDVDFRTVGTGYEFAMAALRQRLAQRVEHGFDLDQTRAAFEILKPGPPVLYIPDNVGEIAFDRVLIEFLRQDLRCRITLCYRGGPITSDAIESDFHDVGLDQRVVDNFICAGPDTLGISPAEMTAELRRAIAETPVILTKGQANFYAACEIVPTLKPSQRVINLLTTKCFPMSARLGQKDKVANIARVWIGGETP